MRRLQKTCEIAIFKAKKCSGQGEHVFCGERMHGVMCRDPLRNLTVVLPTSLYT